MSAVTLFPALLADASEADPFVATIAALASRTSALGRRVDEVPPAEIAGAMEQAQTLIRAAQVLTVELTRRAEAEGTARQEGASSTQAWLAQTAGTSRATAGHQVRFARDLGEAAPLTRHALSDKPSVSLDKAKIVTDAMTKLPARLTTDERARVEGSLLAQAERHSVEDLRRAARRALDVLDPLEADAAEGRALEAEEEQARRAASFWMRAVDQAGMVEGGFTLPALEADILRSVIHGLSAPRRSGAEPTPEPVTDALPLAPDSGVLARQRAGRALSTLIRRLPTDGLGNHGGVPVTLVVTVDERTLRGDLERAGTTAFGTRVSAPELRRLACQAGILPQVLGGLSLPLDLGRRARLFSPAQRVALGHRDGGCAFPGCDRPPGWTEAHHLKPWSEGGGTDLRDGVLLCAHHHRLIHTTEWEVRMAADGQPEFLPPHGVDPTRAPRRNDRWRPRE